MNEFSDLKKLRQILDQLDPPMVMIGRCRDCKSLNNSYGSLSCGHDTVEVSINHDGTFAVFHVEPTFGCTLWERKP